MRLKKIYLLCVLFLIFLTSANAQNSLSGNISDKKNGLPIPNVYVSISGSEKFGKSDSTGKYVIDNIPDGNYDIVFNKAFYTSDSIKISFSNNEQIIKNIELKTKTGNIKSAKILAARKTNTEKSVILEIKNAQLLVSGVSGAQIAKAADRNAAEVIKRVPGVTIVNDKFINIRGLSERYNEVLLNNATAPSAETDNRAFSFDVIPSGVIDRILVYKTPSAELPGNFAGGTVKIFTTTLPDKDAFSIGYSTSFRNGSTGQNYVYTQRSNTDILGYDNSYRVLPNNVPTYINKNDANNSTITKSFANNWKLLSKTASPDQRFQINYQKLWKTKNNTCIGNVTSLSYTSTTAINEITRADYDSTAVNFKSLDKLYTHNVQIAAMENVAFKHKNTKIEFKNLLNQSGKESTTLRSNLLSTDANYKSFAMAYMSKRTLLTQLCGTHKFEHEKINYDWTLSYNNTFRNEPDLRRINYTQYYNGTDSVYKAQVANVVDPISGGGRFYQKLTENAYSFNHNVKRNFNVFHTVLELSAGNFIDYIKILL